MSKELIEEMLEIGLSRYESRAYVSLLQNQNITAYEISKLSGVPQSKIYETMDKLLSKNLVNIIFDNPTKYIALGIDHYLDVYKSSIDDSIEFIQSNIRKVTPKEKISYLVHIVGKENVWQKVHSMLRKVEEFVYLEVWNDDYDEIYDDLKDLTGQGKEVSVVLYGDVHKEIGKVYHHEMDGLLDQKEILGCWMTLIVDGEESLFSINKNDEVQGIWTENESFMVMAEAFIAHDIFLAEIYNKYRNLLDKDFGPNLKKIREHIKIK